MPAKAGELVPLPFTLETLSGTKVAYADKTSLLAAGWTFEYWVAGVQIASPNWSWTNVDTTDGKGEVILTVQDGQGEAFLNPPNGYITNVESFTIDVESTDLAGISSKIDASVGVLAADDRALVTNITVTEGDNLFRALVVPSTALSDWGLTDLTTVTAISAAARARINRIDTSPDFTIGAAITDGANRVVTLSWAVFPTGASISAYSITAVNTATKAFTIAGDQRKYFDGITKILVANSTGNDGSYSIVSMALTGGATVITVSEAVNSSTADGSLAQYEDTKDFLYDCQITFPKTFAVTAVNTGTKTFTFASEQRQYFQAGGSFTISGSTGNDGTYTVVSTALVAGSTAVVVSQVVPSAVANGTATVSIKTTPLKGTITVTRQEDRT